MTVLGPVGEKFKFFNPLGFEAKKDFDHKTSTGTSKRYLNDKNPIHNRETASIFQFSAETFESDFTFLRTFDGFFKKTDLRQWLSIWPTISLPFGAPLASRFAYP